MGLPIRPIIVVEAFPKELEQNQILHISARLFNKKTLALMTVSRIYMSIISLKDGHVVWPLEVIRKNASGFDIGIGTQELKEGHDYLVRVSNNFNLSPSAATTFTLTKSVFPIIALVPIFLSPLFIKKYQDKVDKPDIESLTQYLKSQGFSDEQIKTEIQRILQELDLEDVVKIPIDIERDVAAQKWITQTDTRVCPKCEARTTQGDNDDGIWIWSDGVDPQAPDLPEHKNCRCTYDFFYVTDRTKEFRAAAIMANMLTDLEEPLETMPVIQNILKHKT